MAASRQKHWQLKQRHNTGIGAEINETAAGRERVKPTNNTTQSHSKQGQKTNDETLWWKGIREWKTVYNSSW